MTNKILLEEILKEQKIQAQKTITNFLLISLILWISKVLLIKKISSLLFADSETNRAGYLANHDALDKKGFRFRSEKIK